MTKNAIVCLTLFVFVSFIGMLPAAIGHRSICVVYEPATIFEVYQVSRVLFASMTFLFCTGLALIRPKLFEPQFDYLIRAVSPCSPSISPNCVPGPGLRC